MLIAIVGALITVIGAALLASIAAVLRRLGTVETGLAVVRAQYENNGGSTMRDALDRIEDKQDELTKTVQDHLVVAAGDSARLAAHLLVLH